MYQNLKTIQNYSYEGLRNELKENIDKIKTLLNYQYTLTCSSRSNLARFLELNHGNEPKYQFTESKEGANGANDHVDDEHVGGECAVVKVEEEGKDGEQGENLNRVGVLVTIRATPEVQALDLQQRENDKPSQLHSPNVWRVQQAPVA